MISKGENMGSFNRKFKRRVKRMPLSSLDKTIYFFCIIFLLAVFALLMYLFGVCIPTLIAMKDDSVIAFNNRTGLFCAMPLLMIFTFTGMMIISMLWDNKIPIFGNKKYKPKWSEKVLEMPALFSEEFKGSIKPKTKKVIKYIAIGLLIAMFVSVIVLLLGLCPRHVITKDDRLICYDSFNSVKITENIEDGDKLVLNISYSRSRHGSRHWSIQMKFCFDDEKYTYSPNCFANMSTEQALEHMIYLKSLYEGRYEITNIERMDDLIYDKKYEGRERALVYELFDYS